MGLRIYHSKGTSRAPAYDLATPFVGTLGAASFVPTPAMPTTAVRRNVSTGLPKDSADQAAVFAPHLNTDPIQSFKAVMKARYHLFILRLQKATPL